MDLLEKLAGLESRYEELNDLMSDPAVIGDYVRLREVGQERTALQPSVEAYREYREALRQRAAAMGLAGRVFFTGMVREEDLGDVQKAEEVMHGDDLVDADGRAGQAEDVRAVHVRACGGDEGARGVLDRLQLGPAVLGRVAHTRGRVDHEDDIGLHLALGTGFAQRERQEDRPGNNKKTQ